jgi:hypothetical protein
MWNRKANAARTAEITWQAQRHVGYRSQPNRQSAFQLPGYQGKPWNGTFVDRVLHDALGDFAEVRFVSTVTALGYYVKRNRVFQKPQEGDIVFFNFASDPKAAFEQPHVGVVIDVKPGGEFRTVEGETGTGVPQGSQLIDGVFERMRHVTDAIGFVRPKVRTVQTANGERSKLKMSFFDSNPKTVARHVETVQVALNKVRPLFTFNRGKRDGVFRSALGVYARETGWVENRGELTAQVLQTLADETGTFELD